MAITNKDYIVFTLGALIGAGITYFLTKRSVQKQCYEDYLCSKKEEEGEALDAGEASKYVITDTSKRFDRYTEELAEKREEARKMVSDLEYDMKPAMTGPYVIGAEEYADTLAGYSSMRLNWYPAMNQATNEMDDENATDIAEVVCGLNNIREIESSGELFGYIRNDEKKIDVEVYICYADWPLDESGGDT